MNDRIKSIAEAATYLFLQQGYSKTQISHIAKAAGVSVGTIYLDFTGKKEIMHFVLKCTIAPDFINRKFDRPITDDIFAGLESDIVEMFETTGNDFAKHLSDNAEDYNLEALVSDAFDMLSKYAAGCLFIEKNQFDFRFLAEHYRRYRQRFLKTMTQYMAAFIEHGTVRPLEHLELTTTLIIEILSWWAMDIRYTSFETQDIPVSISKKLCMDNIITAYQCKN
ncbi:TetR/AcrR family transcriptional regulator [Dorea sp. D27]|uniref:TetR/AcrR family transcriptional regulator n=1 Tax=Dorea sp. D27 TaxID=658665 RepID=UPI000673C467|nr:TetR/AcrR family transcriptional regulator [Dorea sp. D27]KMZ55821.1 putative transcriptional regulator, TetR family [Dorea sp. D27]